mmetsp:Transcript_43738/g.95085  ORF Transcript_43738/g.95085 Transcript_43738/m.95085 type:complete len:205 (+) Transcript_43738:1003-1617(+)
MPSPEVDMEIVLPASQSHTLPSISLHKEKPEVRQLMKALICSHAAFARPTAKAPTLSIPSPMALAAVAILSPSALPTLAPSCTAYWATWRASPAKSTAASATTSPTSATKLPVATTAFPKVDAASLISLGKASTVLSAASTTEFPTTVAALPTALPTVKPTSAMPSPISSKVSPSSEKPSPTDSKPSAMSSKILAETAESKSSV